MVGAHYSERGYVMSARQIPKKIKSHPTEDNNNIELVVVRPSLVPFLRNRCLDFFPRPRPRVFTGRGEECMTVSIRPDRRRRGLDSGSAGERKIAQMSLGYRYRGGNGADVKEYTGIMRT